MLSWRPAGSIGSVTFKEFSHLWEFFFYVIAQVHDYRLGHGKASMAAPLVLNVYAVCFWHCHILETSCLFAEKWVADNFAAPFGFDCCELLSDYLVLLVQ